MYNFFLWILTHMNSYKKLLVVAIIALFISTEKIEAFSLNPLTWVAYIVTLFKGKPNKEVPVEIEIESTDSKTLQGSKPTQQDVVVIRENEDLTIAIVCDGHGGEEVILHPEKDDNIEKTKEKFHKVFPDTHKEITEKEDEGEKKLFVDLGKVVASYVSKALANKIEEKLKKAKDPKNSIKDIEDAFLEVDNDLKKLLNHETIKSLTDALSEPRNAVGTTATVTVFDKKNQAVIVAYVGDSRAVLFDKNNNVIFATKDHTLKNKDEEKRFDKKHIQTDEHGIRRIGWPLDKLMVTRAFGDFEVKDIKGFISRPELYSMSRDNLSSPLDGLNKILIGSDGFFDFHKNKDFRNVENISDAFNFEKILKNKQRYTQRVLNLANILVAREGEYASDDLQVDKTRNPDDVWAGLMMEEPTMKELLPKIFKHLSPSCLEKKSKIKNLIEEFQKVDPSLKISKGKNKVGSFKEVPSLIQNQLKNIKENKFHDNTSAILITFKKKQ
jgi:serine/threonine protein phosphatase PrpC